MKLERELCLLKIPSYENNVNPHLFPRRGMQNTNLAKVLELATSQYITIILRVAEKQGRWILRTELTIIS